MRKWSSGCSNLFASRKNPCSILGIEYVAGPSKSLNLYPPLPLQKQFGHMGPRTRTYQPVGPVPLTLSFFVSVRDKTCNGGGTARWDGCQPYSQVFFFFFVWRRGTEIITHNSKILIDKGFLMSCPFGTWPIMALQPSLIYYDNLEKDGRVVSRCLLHSFEYSVVILLNCLLPKAKELSLRCYLIRGWKGDKWIHAFL